MAVEWLKTLLPYAFLSGLGYLDTNVNDHSRWKCQFFSISGYVCVLFPSIFFRGFTAVYKNRQQNVRYMHQKNWKIS